MKVTKAVSTVRSAKASLSSRPMDTAVEAYRRERFLKAANAEFAALKREGEGRKMQSRERKIWERTLGDGLGEK